MVVPTDLSKPGQRSLTEAAGPYSSKHDSCYPLPFTKEVAKTLANKSFVKNHQPVIRTESYLDLSDKKILMLFSNFT